MTILIDPRSGSKSLVDHIPPALCQLSKDNLDGDFEFAASGLGGLIMPAGGEYKTISDFLTSSTDGRLWGTQLPRMLRSYSRVYLIIEGATRVSESGILETKQFDPVLRQYRWAPARGRKGEGWTAQEYWSRICSIEEFGRTPTGEPVRVCETFNVQSSARRIMTFYHYWQKDYEAHSSYRAWDQSGEQKPLNALLMTSELPLVQRWAADLRGVGQDKSKYVAMHFRSAGAMARATERDWEKVEFIERVRTGPNKGQTKKKKMSTKKAREVVDEINEEFK